jgi:acyl-CoA thioesterase YciA
MDDAKPPATEPRGQLTIRNVAMPADTNPSGDIFGGWIMGLMDLSAGVAGRERAKGRVVTAHVSSLSFLHPVKVGDVVCCYTSVAGTGRTSITLDVETWVVRDQRIERMKVTEAKFVMVAVDSEGKPRPLDP